MAPPTLLLTDNGSRRPEAYENLTRLAASLTERLGHPVAPVSMLHTPAGPPGSPPRTLREYLAERTAVGQLEYGLVPLFLGPSGALTSYLPNVVAERRETVPGLQVRVGDLLYRSDESDLVTILADLVATADLPGAPVVVCDHGSPNPEVTRVRDCLTARLGARYGPSRSVQAASMERREGPEYDFNDPLLAAALRAPGVAERPCVLAMLFLGPGRHAGPGGDIDALVAKAEARSPGLRVVRTPLLSDHPRFLDLLERRARAVLA